MNQIFLLLALFAILACQKSPSTQPISSNPQEQQADHLVNGELIQRDSEQKDYSVLLEVIVNTDVKNKGNGEKDTTQQYYLCSGALIAKDIIITATHCLTGAQSISAIFSTSNVNVEQKDVRTGTSFVTHPLSPLPLSLNNIKLNHDVALIKLDSPAPGRQKILRLPPEELFQKQQGNFELQFFGYGDASGLGLESESAGQLRTKKFSFNQNDMQNELFTMSQHDGGICDGDSGGPAVYFQGGEAYLIAIASGISWNVGKDKTPGFNRCKENSFYSNIFYYKKWILSEIAKFNH